MASTTWRMDLIDEVHLLIAPILVGGGQRIFPDQVRHQGMTGVPRIPAVSIDYASSGIGSTKVELTDQVGRSARTVPLACRPRRVPRRAGPSGVASSSSRALARSNASAPSVLVLLAPAATSTSARSSRLRKRVAQSLPGRTTERLSNSSGGSATHT
ncbi:MAG: dihydrofolate reductase family protein [Mycetocola sp.]